MALRECNSGDYPKLVEFWNLNAGWDVIGVEIWKERFVSSPNEKSFVVIVEQEGIILAQLVFISMIVSTGNGSLLASRPFAAVAKKSNSILGYKFIVQLFNFGITLLKKKKFDILIMLPDPRWRRLAGLVDCHVFSFPLFKLSMSKYLKLEISGNEVRSIDFDDMRINSLWDEISRQDVYMISRSGEFLKWKNSHLDYKIIGIFHGNSLIGVATFLEKAKENQIQICDLLYKAEVEEQVIQEVSSYLINKYSSNSQFNRIVCLATDSLKVPLSKAGYEYGNYDFFFWIKLLNSDISMDVLSISKWYLSAND